MGSIRETSSIPVLVEHTPCDCETARSSRGQRTVLPQLESHRHVFVDTFRISQICPDLIRGIAHMVWRLSTNVDHGITSGQDSDGRRLLNMRRRIVVTNDTGSVVTTVGREYRYDGWRTCRSPWDGAHCAIVRARLGQLRANENTTCYVRFHETHQQI